MARSTGQEKLFFSMLQFALWNIPLCPDDRQSLDDTSWETLWKQARKQAVGGLLFQAMAALPAESQPCRTLKLEMAAHADAVVWHNELLADALVQITATYKAHRIPYLLLKGATVAAAYPHPEYRTGGDIDFYIPPEECIRAQQLLFGSMPPNNKENRHYSGMYGKVRVENHFRLTYGPPQLYRNLAKELLSEEIRMPLQQLQIKDGIVTAPSPTFQALFMLEHMAFHLPQGLGVRHLCDWAVYLRHFSSEIDYENAGRILREHGLSRIANIFSLLCVEQLGMPEYCALTPLVRNRRTTRDTRFVLKEILQGGNFGRHYTAAHSTQGANKYPAFIRKPLLLLIALRDHRKYALISPSLLRKTIWHHLQA